VLSCALEVPYKKNRVMQKNIFNVRERMFSW
jgi:hypothetical protein